MQNIYKIDCYISVSQSLILQNFHARKNLFYNTNCVTLLKSELFFFCETASPTRALCVCVCVCVRVRVCTHV